MAQHYPSLSSVPGERLYQLRVLGTGAADPTVEVGQGMTVARTGTGAYRITFTDGPGTFIGIAGYIFGAATPGDVKGQTLTRDTWTTPTSTADGFLDVAVWNSSFAADDLQATEYLDIRISFSVVSGAH